jgi:hypothetical protein
MATAAASATATAEYPPNAQPGRATRTGSACASVAGTCVFEACVPDLVDVYVPSRATVPGFAAAARVSRYAVTAAFSAVIVSLIQVSQEATVIENPVTWKFSSTPPVEQISHP